MKTSSMIEPVPHPESYDAGMTAFRQHDYGAALTQFDLTLDHMLAPAMRSSAIVMRARCLRELGRLDEADATIAPLVASETENPDPAEIYAWIAHSRGDWPEAERRWSTMRARWPHHLAGYFGGGAVLVALHRFDEADRVYRYALRHISAAPHILIGFARAAQARRDWDETAKRWAILTTLFPEELAGHLGAVEAFMAGERYEAADAALNTARGYFPTEPKLLIAAAQSAQRQGDGPRSLGIWQELRALSPDSAMAFLEESKALEAIGQLDEAERVLAAAAARFSENGEVVERWAALAARRKDWVNAARRFQHILGRAPDNRFARISFASALGEMGRHDDAEAVITEGLRETPNAVDLLIGHAEMALRQAEWAVAADRWRTVLAASRDDSRAALGLANALMRQANYDAAEALMSDFVTRFPDAHQFAMMHAAVAAQRGDRAEGLRRWESANARFPGNAWARDQLTALYQEVGRESDARAMIAQARARGDADPSFFLVQARVEEVAGNWAEASRFLQEFLKVDPGNARIRTLFAHVQGQAQLAELEAGDDRSPPEQIVEKAAPVATAPSTMFDIVKHCESLGDNCEFGLVQRHFEAEPLGLLRWAATKPEELIAALESRLEGVGSPENTRIVTWPNGEYGVLDTRYGMQMHTFTYETSIDRDRFGKLQMKRSRFLRDKLLEDIKAAEKLFVYKCQEISTDQAIRLSAALRAIGPATLLVVRLHDAAHPAGTVEPVSEGLLLGYLDVIAPFEAPTTNLSIKGWSALCEKGFRLWKGLSI